MSVLVVGSVNADTTWRVETLPRAGETVLSAGGVPGLGGKGANCAVAARALDAETALLAAVGDDQAGAWLVRALDAAHLPTDALVRVAGPSGRAQVVVDAAGENLIVVAPGANSLLTPEHVAALGVEPAVVVTQLEIPLDTVAAALLAGRRSGAVTILNAAPAAPLDDRLLGLVDVLVVNEGEAAALAGVADPRAAAARLRARGATAVLVSLGAAGALLDDGTATLLPAPPNAKVVDTTGAGDVLVGALAAGLARDDTLLDAAGYAVHAATWSVGQHGVAAPKPGDLR